MRMWESSGNQGAGTRRDGEMPSAAASSSIKAKALCQERAYRVSKAFPATNGNEFSFFG